MAAPITESFNDGTFTREDLYGVYVKGSGVAISHVCPELIDFIRQDLMEAKGMHAPEELWRRLARFREEKAVDPGWAAFFRGIDFLQEQNWHDALIHFNESRGIFLGRNDAWAAQLADNFIRDAELLQKKENTTPAAESPAQNDARQMMNDELLWQWWRITHLPWD
jgi:hypothetical protein